MPWANTVVLPNRVRKKLLSKFDILNIVIILLHIKEREGSEFCLLCSLNVLIAEYEKSVVPLSPVMI